MAFNFLGMFIDQLELREVFAHAPILRYDQGVRLKLKTFEQNSHISLFFIKHIFRFFIRQFSLCHELTVLLHNVDFIYLCVLEERETDYSYTYWCQ